MNVIWRPLLMFAGHVSLALAILGVFLPILPTTPFVLLASACYARSSIVFHEMLRRHPWFGSILENWERDKSISLRAKYTAVSMIAAGISISLFFVPLIEIRYVLILIGIAVSLFILTRRTAES